MVTKVDFTMPSNISTALLIIGATIGLILISLPLLRITVKRMIVNQAQRSANHIATVERDPLLADLQTGKPTIVYFTSPGCGPCKTTQKPILNKLQQERGDSFQLLTINIEEHMDASLRWGVMKVPRTFVLDHNLRLYASNLDIARLDTLKQQLDEAEAAANLPMQPLKLV